MIDLCQLQGLKEPEWIAENGTIKVVFRRPSVGISDANVSESGSQSGSQSGTEYVSQKRRLSERQRKIKVMIKDDDTISVAKISSIIDVAPRTIYRDLKQIGIHWEGSPKSGHWVIKA